MISLILLVSTPISVAFADNNVGLTQQISEHAGVVQNSNGDYFLNVNGQNVSVGRLDVSLLDDEAVNAVLASASLSEEVKNEIREKTQLAKETNQDIVSTIFSADLISPRLRSGVTYGTYQGHNMKTDRVDTQGVGTGFQEISQGSNTKNVANGIVNLILTGVGLSNVPVSLVAAGKTLLDFFIDAVGSQFVAGSTTDKLQVKLFYDVSNQWTYGEYSNGSGDWRLGLYTQEVKLKTVGVYQYYYTAAYGGKENTTNKSVSATIRSPHFNDQYQTAWLNVNTPYSESISWKIGSKTFIF
jgi:hypothetical protein